MSKLFKLVHKLIYFLDRHGYFEILIKQISAPTG